MDPELNLEHCLLRWQIEHFDLWSAECSQLLSTPYFRLNAMSLAKWQLSLLPIPDGRKGIIKFRLYRSLDDEGPEEAYIIFRLDLSVLKESNDYTIWPREPFEKQNRTFTNPFKKDSEFIIKTFGLNHVLRTMCKNSNSTSLTIALNMCFLCENDVLNEKAYVFPPPDPEYRKLSKDLTKMFYDKQKMDFTVHTSNGVIKAHRAVIALRAPGLDRKYLVSSRKIYLSDIPVDAVRILLLHMYSGDYKLDTGHAAYFPLLRKYAFEWKVYPLKDWLTPNEMFLRSETDCELCEFVWTIRNYNVYEEHVNEVNSPVFTTGHNQTEEWSLRLLPNGNETSEYITVELHTSNLKRKVWASMFLVFHLQNDPKIKPKTFYVASRVEWLTSDIALQCCSVSKKTVKKALHNDFKLRLCFTLKLTSTAKYQTIMEESTSFSETPNPEGNSFRALSDDFQNYKMADRYADLKLACSRLAVGVHKSILCARSTYFAQLCEKRKLPKIYFDAGCVPAIPFQLPELGNDPSVINNLLLYLYSGKIVNFNPIQTVNFALLADKLSLNNLYKRCSVYLQTHLEPDSIGEVLVLATSIQDSELKDSAFRYITKHSQIIFQTTQWQTFENNWIELAQEVREVIKKTGYLKKTTTTMLA